MYRCNSSSNRSNKSSSSSSSISSNLRRNEGQRERGFGEWAGEQGVRERDSCLRVRSTAACWVGCRFKHWGVEAGGWRGWGREDLDRTPTLEAQLWIRDARYWRRTILKVRTAIQHRHFSDGDLYTTIQHSPALH